MGKEAVVARSSSEWYGHALALAKQHNVRMVMDSTMPPFSARALVPLRLVEHAPIVCDRSYIEAMHEMGHIVHPQGAREAELQKALAPDGSMTTAAMTIVVEREEAAWSWARANALEWTNECERK